MKPQQKKKSAAVGKLTELDKPHDVLAKAEQGSAVDDAYVEWLLSQKGTISAHLDLEF